MESMKTTCEFSLLNISLKLLFEVLFKKFCTSLPTGDRSEFWIYGKLISDGKIGAGRMQNLIALTWIVSSGCKEKRRWNYQEELKGNWYSHPQTIAWSVTWTSFQRHRRKRRKPVTNPHREVGDVRLKIANEKHSCFQEGREREKKKAS